MDSEEVLDENFVDEDTNETYNIRASIGFHDHAADAAKLWNEVLAIHLPDGIFWTASHVEWTFELRDLIVVLSNRNGFKVVATSDFLPRKILDALRNDLRCLLESALLETTWNTTSFAVMLIQLAEISEAYSQEYRRAMEFRKGGAGWCATSVRRWEDILDNPFGVDLLTVNDTAMHLLGQSITDICKGFPEHLRILHVEPVFRSDLVRRFLQHRLDMKERLMAAPVDQLRKSITRKQIRSGEVVETHDGIVDHLTTPKITFHGAPRHVVSSIVRYGFLKPGSQIGQTKNEVQMSSGAKYGSGIYCSPSPEYASFYGRWTPGSGESLDFFNPSQIPGFRMVVSATLMGRTAEAHRRDTGVSREKVYATANSLVSPDRLEYIVFDSAQIIPCYVLHVDYGSDLARDYIKCCLKDPKTIGKSKAKSRIDLDTYDDEDLDTPGAKKARKDALKAAAAKWFPYGYGPSTGTNFVIEEIGYVSDDEEDFGEFQALRGEHGHEIRETFQRKDEKVSWFDEYQYVRNTKKELDSDS